MEHAIKSNDAGLIEINDGFDINGHYAEGDTALHIAVSNDASAEILKVLVKNGSQLDLKNYKEETPIGCLKKGSIMTMISLLQLEQEFDLSDNDGNTVIHRLLGRMGGELFDAIDVITEGETNADGDLDFSESDKLIKSFWSFLLQNFHACTLQIDLNRRNLSG